MPVYKDKKNGTWYVQVSYKDWTGKARQKRKRGFKRQADAKEFEREFLSGLKYNVEKSDILFSTLVEKYIEDISVRLKQSTIETKKSIINDKILPYLGRLKVNEITPMTIRSWQNTMINDKNGYSQTYLRAMNNQLSAIMNYAVKYYSLPSNPCSITGSIGKKNADAMKIWTKDEYERVIRFVHSPSYHLAFEILYWTGMREGEMLALTPADILDNRKIVVNKTFSVINGEDVFTDPKTEKSKREISIPEFLYNEIQEYIGRLYEIHSNERIFYFKKYGLARVLNEAADKAGVEHIRIHDLRHSHAALLVDMGYSIFAIAERLGHDRPSTTMNTYGHLYPQRRDDLVSGLEAMRNIDNKND